MEKNITQTESPDNSKQVLNVPKWIWAHQEEPKAVKLGWSTQDISVYCLWNESHNTIMLVNERKNKK